MPLPAAMDGLFADGVYLRLRSRARGTYLHAEKDGVGLSLLPRGGDDGAPAEAGVWRVHRVQRDGDNYVLLHGAAYGRYLALSDEAAPHGCVGKRAVQRGYDDPELDAVMWKPSAVSDAPAGHVLMRHLLNGTLRANGRFRVWNNGVSIDMYFGNRSTMRQWIVEVVPPRPQGYVPVLPAPSETLQHHTFLFWWPGAPEGARRRTIRYLHADQPLDFGPASNVPSFSYCSRSVYDLRNQLGIRVNHGHILGTIMCV
ncbi:hypothetical protein HU200_064877 [Digitaria exilis]|uniref:DUF569 domain-containing protein n=1 Tax=Digitaria exilis TaxID=1010633 RepID=A0A835AAQ9_9POAL|nr:hypothetical protein HU200_064877 [Digitaria exilis]